MRGLFRPIAVTDDYLRYVLEQLAGLGHVITRRMFGADRFRPFPDKPHLSMTYYSVPADTLEDADECVVWARKSLGVAGVSSNPATRRAKNRGR